MIHRNGNITQRLKGDPVNKCQLQNRIPFQVRAEQTLQYWQHKQNAEEEKIYNEKKKKLEVSKRQREREREHCKVNICTILTDSGSSHAHHHTICA